VEMEVHSASHFISFVESPRRVIAVVKILLSFSVEP
jgi:hypothetical protein